MTLQGGQENNPFLSYYKQMLGEEQRWVIFTATLESPRKSFRIKLLDNFSPILDLYLITQHYYLNQKLFYFHPHHKIRNSSVNQTCIFFWQITPYFYFHFPIKAREGGHRLKAKSASCLLFPREWVARSNSLPAGRAPALLCAAPLYLYSYVTPPQWMGTHDASES